MTLRTVMLWLLTGILLITLAVRSPTTWFPIGAGVVAVIVVAVWLRQPHGRHESGSRCCMDWPYCGHERG